MKAVSPVIPGHEACEVKIAEGQPEYETLPALLVGGDGARGFYVGSLRDSHTVISRFELSDEEVETLNRTKTLYLYVRNFGGPLQPVLVTTEEPEVQST
jgi:hypothetical protein